MIIRRTYVTYEGKALVIIIKTHVMIMKTSVTIVKNICNDYKTLLIFIKTFRSL